MPATNKVGTQLLVSPHIRARAQALALVRQESVAEVWRRAVEGFGLPGMERANRAELAELDKALEAIGGDRVATLDYLTANKFSYGDLFYANGAPRKSLPAPLRKVS